MSSSCAVTVLTELMVLWLKCTDCIFKISESHLSSSEESIKGKFYQTLKKISTTQNLEVEQQTPGRSPTLIIVKPVYKI